MRFASQSDEYAQSIYEYKLEDDSRRIGVDLLKFYELRLNKKNQER